MIKSFEHKGLKNFFATGTTKGVQAIHVARLNDLLTALNAMTQIEDLNAPSFRLHRLKGNKKELWSITVQANWRITFKFENGDVYVVNYTDYH